MNFQKILDLKNKSQVFANFKQWKILVEKQQGRTSRDLEHTASLNSIMKSLMNFVRMKTL